MIQILNCVWCGWRGESPVKRILKVAGIGYPIECRHCHAIGLKPIDCDENLGVSALALASETMPNKYNARKVHIDGLTFDSLAEHRRWSELKLLQQSGVIAGLTVHDKWPLYVKGVLVCRYESDFCYAENNRLTVEDVKGKATEMYKLKKKMMRACWGIEIVEIDS